MSPDDVEAIAEGRVWTGDQAKRNGLVDELGGLYRAIAYARRNFTEADAEIVVWPRKTSLWDLIKEASDEGDAMPLLTVIRNLLHARQSSVSAHAASDDATLVQKLCCLRGLPGTLSGSFYAIDEDSALRCLVDGVGEKANRNNLFYM
jgi:ClpP class serine protease